MPKSLAGQMALLLGLALFVAQLVNFALILNERQKLSLARNEGPAITRFVTLASDLGEAAPEFRNAVLADNSRRGARFSVQPTANVPADGSRNARLESQLAEALASAQVSARQVRAAVTTERREARRGDRGRPQEVQILLLGAQIEGAHWLNGRLVTPRPDPFLSLRLGTATLLLYIIVLGASVLIAMRIARPLRALAIAAEQFGGRGQPTIVTPRGPEDIRRALEAFNAMNARVVALLDEKDRMLGAIGHDLRTPLASLRIRAESVAPEAERQRIIDTIAEMTATLEDMLVLARSGRAREDQRPMDVTALVEALVEEYRERESPVETVDSSRQVLSIQPNLLRRAVRNLIDNAVKYGGSARVSVRAEGGQVAIEVRDSGPGLAPDQLNKVLEPFYRIEESRNRETGGIGLGLSIAKAIAENHGGSLQLENSAEGGLVGIVWLPQQ